MQDRLARRVLLTHRARFPGTLRAKEASFLLGRLAEGHGGHVADALTWYDRYLQEAPSGAYAAEAMGRMMIVLDRQQRIDEARAVAATYLRRFPQGIYARAARGVLSR
jgi:TolA-binding protein